MHSNRNALSWIKRQWERNAEIDPLWTIITRPDRRNRRWREDEFFATGKEVLDHHLQRLKSEGIEVKFGCALDFGCGVGRLTRALSLKFAQATGVDVSERMLALAQNLNKEHANLSFVHNVATDLSCFPSGSFDFVYCLITLQHMPSDLALAYFSEFLRVTRPGGLVLVQLVTHKTPGLWYWPPSLLRRLWRSLNSILLWSPHMEMHVFEEAKVHALAAQAGSSVLATWPDSSGGGRFESKVFVIRTGFRGTHSSS